VGQKRVVGNVDE